MFLLSRLFVLASALFLQIGMATASEVNTQAVEEARRYGQPDHPINYNPKVIIYKDMGQIPESPKQQPNEETLYYYFKRYNSYQRFGPTHYESQPSANPYEFEKDLRDVPYVSEQLSKTALISYLHYEDGRLVADKKVPSNRFGGEITDETKLWSASIAKSMTSYLMGHAICEGYIDGINQTMDDWPLIEGTLYHGQKIIDLLNMRRVTRIM